MCMGAEVHVGLGDMWGREEKREQAPAPSVLAIATGEAMSPSPTLSQGPSICDIFFLPWVVFLASGMKNLSRERVRGRELCLCFGFITKPETIILATDLFLG